MRKLCLITLLLFACDKGGTSSPPAKTPAPVVSLADPLALLPADSDIVIRVDVAAMRKSPLFPKYEKLALGFLFPGFVDCDYDPLQHVTTVTAGVPMASELGIFVVRGLDREKFMACLRTSKADTPTTATFDGDFVTLTNKSGAVNIVTFVEPTTMVMQGSTKPTKETLTAALKVGAPLRNHAQLLAVEKKTVPGAALTIMSVPGSKAFAEQLRAKVGAPVKYMYSSFQLTDRLEAHVGIAMVNPPDAAAIVENMRPQLEASKPYVDRLESHAAGDTVELHIAITEPQLKAIVDMVQSMMGGAD